MHKIIFNGIVKLKLPDIIQLILIIYCHLQQPFFLSDCQRLQHLPTTDVVALTVALCFVVQDYEHHKSLGVEMVYIPPGGRFT